MRYSVIIPCFNAAETIGLQLDALVRQCPSPQWEVVIADNGSTDKTVNVVDDYKDKLPNLRVVDASGRRGASHARNVGAKAASGDTLIFVDADDEIDGGFIDAMAAALNQYDFVAPSLDCEKLSSRRALAMKGNRRQRDGLTEYSYVPFLPYGDTSGLGVKRRVHEAIGGFDENLLACEDCDYGWRIQMAGTALYFVADALLHSRHKDPLEGAFNQARTWGKAHAQLIKKFRPLGMPKPQLTTGLKLWWHLLRRPPFFSTQAYRDAWLWNFYYRYGQLLGCIKYRILAL